LTKKLKNIKNSKFFTYLIGLILLRTKLASWRYQKTSRPINIIPNVKANDIDNTESITCIKKTISNDNEDQEIPPAIEDIIEQLIQGLRDKAITIRYIDVITYINHLLEITLSINIINKRTGPS